MGAWQLEPIIYYDDWVSAVGVGESLVKWPTKATGTEVCSTNSYWWRDGPVKETLCEDNTILLR